MFRYVDKAKNSELPLKKIRKIVSHLTLNEVIVIIEKTGK